MKKKTKLQIAAVAVFSAVAVLFTILFLDMGIFENVSIYKSGDPHTYEAAEVLTQEQIPDASAPAGVRTVYRWTLSPAENGENCLCFYIVHHYAQVYYDGELMYSLIPSENNRIGKTVSSNWVATPIRPEDRGKEVTVVLTPLFESVIGQEVEFLVGSHFSVVFDELKQDLPQLFLSTLCILLGFFMMAVQAYFASHTKAKVWNIFFLGSFSVLLGLWRITDIKLSSMLFSGNPMVLGYITIGSLFLCCVPLLLYISTLFTDRRAKLLQAVSLVGSAVALLALTLQVLGIAELKETLALSHIMLIVTVVTVLLSIITHKKGSLEKQSNRAWKYFWLLALGIIMDMIVFYVRKSSSDVIFTISTFIVYALIVFVTSIRDTTKKAYTDFHTGLANKTRWNELMKDHSLTSVGIMMLDLNGLKQVNDTLGHDAGDRMIFDFSNILRTALPAGSTICRWGGDEFAALIAGTGRAEMERYVEAIANAVDGYNTSYDEPSISFAAGFALEEEHPELSREALLTVADQQMYQHKKEWYSQNP